MALLGRDTSVTGPFPPGTLLLESLEGRETLGTLYSFDLVLLSLDPNIDPYAVLGKPLTVAIKLNSGQERFFHGVVMSFGKIGTTRLHTRYTVKLRPSLATFEHTRDNRVFNEPGQNALGIVTEMLAAKGLTDIESGTIKSHPFRARDYCVQYRESDRHFVQRLLEEEGIYYFFRHEQNKHTMVLADSITAHAPAEGYETVLYTPKQRTSAGVDEHFWSMVVSASQFPGLHTARSSYDPTRLRPKKPQDGEAQSTAPEPGSQFEHYDEASGLYDPEEARLEAAIRNQIGCAGSSIVEVEGNTMGLGVGHLVRMLPGPQGAETYPFWRQKDFGKQYLVVGATYRFTINQYETGQAASKDEPYKAKYWMIDSQKQFRPERTTDKPRIEGPAPAIVVGPPGEEIWTDKLGRVRVQFDWDRLGKFNEKSTCWVRVATEWAGPKWGTIFLPRIGQEVLVRFFACDPDSPFIMGRLYNKDNPPPYALPANKTQSGIKSRSSKNGTADNFNEIRFEDKKGHEELHVQAEKDMSTLVKNDQTLHVGVNREVTVGNDESNYVYNDRALTVEKNDEVTINGTHDKTVLNTVMQLYADDHLRKVDGDQELYAEKNKFEHVKLAHTLTTDKKFQLNQGPTSMTFAGSNVTLDAAGVITMTAGGATMTIDKAGEFTVDSPTGISLICGASTVAITPGGVSFASPAFTVASGAGTTMAMGKAGINVKSKDVNLESAGVFNVKGKSKLKLQESDAGKGGGGKPDSVKGKREDRTAPGSMAGKRLQKKEDANKATLEIHVVDLNKKPQEGVAFQIKMPDGETVSGKLDKDGRGMAKSAKPGIFTVTFPDLDGADWDGDGAQPPEGTRSEASTYEVEQGDRLPTIARMKGFARWQTIWDFPANKALKDLRGNAHILYPKDKVAIPSKLSRVAKAQAGTAEFVLQTTPEFLRVRFMDAQSADGEPVKFRATPDVGDKVLQGNLTDDGTMNVELPPGSKQVLVDLYRGDTNEVWITYDFQVGAMDPISEITGIQARLANLGYYEGEIDGNLGDSTKAAILDFRKEAGLPPSGEIDGDLREALESWHDKDSAKQETQSASVDDLTEEGGDFDG